MRSENREEGLKILFLLFYLKGYPTFDVLGGIFGLSRNSCRFYIKLLKKWELFLIVLSKMSKR